MALYDVWVMGFSPDAGDPVPGLMRTFRLEEAKARELEQTVPRIVKRRVPKAKGEKIARALRKLGGEVMVRPARMSSGMMEAVSTSEPPPPKPRAPAMSILAPADSLVPSVSEPPGTSVAPPSSMAPRADSELPASSQFPVDSMPPGPAEEPREFIPPEESQPDHPIPLQVMRRRHAATRIAGSSSQSEPPGALFGRRKKGSSAPPGLSPARPVLPKIPAPAALPAADETSASPDAWELDTDRPVGSGAPQSSSPPGLSDAPPLASAAPAAPEPAEPPPPAVPIVVPRPPEPVAMELDGPVRQPTPVAGTAIPPRLGTPAAGTPLGSLAPGSMSPGSMPAPASPPSSRAWLGAAALLAVGLLLTGLRLSRGQSIFYGNGGWLFGAWLDAFLLASIVVGGWRLFSTLVLGQDGEMAANASNRMAWFMFPIALAINWWGPLESNDAPSGLGGTVDQRIASMEGKADACLDTALTDASCADCCDTEYEMDDGDCVCDVPFRCLEGNKSIEDCRSCCQKALDRPARGVVFTSEQGCICDAHRELIE